MNENLKPNVLFLCTHNSCRSQIAEAWAKNLLKDQYNIYSAGTVATKVDSMVIVVMQDVGINISDQYSKTIEDLKDIEFDYVITVCDNANEACPTTIYKNKLIHHNFLDPSKLTEKLETVEEKLPYYRQVRDEIKLYIKNLPDLLK